MELTGNEDAEACLYALQLAGYAVLPMTLKAAIELGALEVLVKSSGCKLLSAGEVASELGIANPDAPAMLDRMLRLLASFGILRSSLAAAGGAGAVVRLYGAAPVCKYLTKNKDGVSVASLCLMNHDKVQMECWHHLKDAVLEGGVPFNRAYGMASFEYFGKDLRLNQVFNAGMSDFSTMAVKKILGAYTGFEGLKTVVDVGGGVGATLDVIISKYPGIKGINFDLPHVIDEALPLQGVEHVPGDMFAGVPSGDAIFMRGVLHDWGDQHCVKLLRNCREALPENGKVIVAEGVLPVAPESGAGAKLMSMVDMIMLANTNGGRERTVSEFQSLAEDAGFSGFKVASHVPETHTYIMEFTK